MLLAAASGATDAIGYLALGNVFTSAMTGNLALLGIALAHRDGERVGRVLVSLVCYMVGAAIGARVARSPQPGDPVWPPAITRAMAIEAVFFVAYAGVWWTVGAGSDVYTKAVLLGLGAIALGIQSSAMQRFDNGLGLNTTFVSGALIKLVGQLATGHRFRDIRHHLLVLVGLVCGCFLGALLVFTHRRSHRPCRSSHWPSHSAPSVGKHARRVGSESGSRESISARNSFTSGLDGLRIRCRVRRTHRR